MAWQRPGKGRSHYSSEGSSSDAGIRPEGNLTRRQGVGSVSDFAVPSHAIRIRADSRVPPAGDQRSQVASAVQGLPCLQSSAELQRQKT